MIDQRNKDLTYGESLSSFFKGFVDFSGYSSRKGHWFPFLTISLSYLFITLLLLSAAISSFVFIGSKSNTYNIDKALGSAVSTAGNVLLGIIILSIIGIIISIPMTASFARRLRDVGFTNWGIGIAIALFYIFNFCSVAFFSFVYSIVFTFVLMSLAPNTLETNKNDAILTFLFRQTPKAKEYYSQFDPFANNNFEKTNNQNNVQKNNNVPVQQNVVTPNTENLATNNNIDHNQNPTTQNADLEEKIVENKVDQEKTQENQNTNPFGDKPFNK